MPREHGCNEKPHPKAIFMTRYGGSSGTGLFYLNLNKKSLDLISGMFTLKASLSLKIWMEMEWPKSLYGRVDDRSETGAAVLHWNGDGYDLWWPNWPSGPYVIYAKLIDLDKNGNKEIVAVLDPAGASAGTSRTVKSGSVSWEYGK